MPKDEFPPRTPPTMHRCSFCGKTQDQVRRLVAGPNVYICNECILLCQEIISDDLAAAAPTTSDPKDLPKPAEMKAVLDDYVVGQEEAKRALHPDLTHKLEGVALMRYVVLAFVGVVLGASFCQNVFYYHGDIGALFSSGTVFWMGETVAFDVFTAAVTLSIGMLSVLYPQDIDNLK